MYSDIIVKVCSWKDIVMLRNIIEIYLVCYIYVEVSLGGYVYCVYCKKNYNIVLIKSYDGFFFLKKNIKIFL